MEEYRRKPESCPKLLFNQQKNFQSEAKIKRSKRKIDIKYKASNGSKKRKTIKGIQTKINEFTRRQEGGKNKIIELGELNKEIDIERINNKYIYRENRNNNIEKYFQRKENIGERLVSKISPGILYKQSNLDKHLTPSTFHKNYYMKTLKESGDRGCFSVPKGGMENIYIQKTKYIPYDESTHTYTSGEEEFCEESLGEIIDSHALSPSLDTISEEQGVDTGGEEDNILLDFDSHSISY